MKCAELRLRGYKRCEWAIKNYSGFRPMRTINRKKGERCKRLVSPVQIREHGCVICTLHLKPYKQELARSVGAYVTRKNRLDPGPVDI